MYLKNDLQSDSYVTKSDNFDLFKKVHFQDSLSSCCCCSHVQFQQVNKNPARHIRDSIKRKGDKIGMGYMK